MARRAAPTLPEPRRPRSGGGGAARGGLGAANAACARDDLGRIFHLWHQFRRGELDREHLRVQAAPWQASLRTGLELGEMFGNAKQRALRTGVIWRKTSFGSQSERGRQYAERMLSVVGSTRLHGVKVLDYLTAVILASHAGQPAPNPPLASPP